MAGLSNTPRSLSLAALLTLLASTALAQVSITIGSTMNYGSHCHVHNATLALPVDGTVAVQPGDIVKYIALAVGQQEYTCKNQDWVLTGAKASLYDISCQYNTTSISSLSLAFSGLANAVMNLLDTDDYSGAFAKSVQAAAGISLNQLGSVATSDGKLYSFDFTASGGGSRRGTQGKASGLVVQSQPAPVSSYDVDWFRVNLTSGGLAQDVYQAYTSGGRPATYGLACTDGQKDNAPYSAQMWFYAGNTKNRFSAATFAERCSKRIRTTKATKQMITIPNMVQYGPTDKDCTSIEDCTKKCLAVKNCVGYSISTEDGEGVTKLRVLSSKMGYASNFNSGVVRKLTNKQYVDRQGDTHDCPKGQVSSSDFSGCVVPVECSEALST